MSIGKKNVILAVVLCISISVIGISFAYFTSGVTVSGEGSKTELKPADMLKVSYDAGSNSINLANAMPGTTASKDFSVTVTPTESEKSVTYAIVLDISSNNFEKVNVNELEYTLKSKEGSVLSSGDLTEAQGKITLLKETKKVETATTFEYSLEITYKETGSDQNHNANKTFSSNLKVEFAEA